MSTSAPQVPLSLSVIVPMFNECDNARLLSQKIVAACESTGRKWELILVDDGSTDQTRDVLSEISAEDPRVLSVFLRRNYGQSAAIQAGFEVAQGDAIVTLDGDLQNDPADIPRLISHLDEGYDMVHGWRRRRHDTWLTRRLPSRIANWLIRKVIDVPVQDLGCALKAVRREVVDGLDLYGEMHRFIAVLAASQGARILEVPVQHHPRQHGVSKYGLSRTPRVLLDLLTVKFLTVYLDRPMSLLGRAGLASGVAGAAALLATIFMKTVNGVDMTGNPLLLLSTVMGLTSLQLFGLGLLGEMSTRMYYLRSGRRPFAVRDAIGRGLGDMPASKHAA